MHHCASSGEFGHVPASQIRWFQGTWSDERSIISGKRLPHGTLQFDIVSATCRYMIVCVFPGGSARVSNCAATLSHVQDLLPHAFQSTRSGIFTSLRQDLLARVNQARWTLVQGQNACSSTDDAWQALDLISLTSATDRNYISSMGQDPEACCAADRIPVLSDVRELEKPTNCSGTPAVPKQRNGRTRVTRLGERARDRGIPGAKRKTLPIATAPETFERHAPV